MGYKKKKITEKEKKRTIIAQKEDNEITPKLKDMWIKIKEEENKYNAEMEKMEIELHIKNNKLKKLEEGTEREELKNAILQIKKKKGMMDGDLQKQVFNIMYPFFNFIQDFYRMDDIIKEKGSSLILDKRFNDKLKTIKDNIDKNETPFEYLYTTYGLEQKELFRTTKNYINSLKSLYIKFNKQYKKIVEKHKPIYTKYVYELYRFDMLVQEKKVLGEIGGFYKKMEKMEKIEKALKHNGFVYFFDTLFRTFYPEKINKWGMGVNFVYWIMGMTNKFVFDKSKEDRYATMIKEGNYAALYNVDAHQMAHDILDAAIDVFDYIDDINYNEEKKKNVKKAITHFVMLRKEDLHNKINKFRILFKLIMLNNKEDGKVILMDFIKMYELHISSQESQLNDNLRLIKNMYLLHDYMDLYLVPKSPYLEQKNVNKQIKGFNIEKKVYKKGKKVEEVNIDIVEKKNMDTKKNIDVQLAPQKDVVIENVDWVIEQQKEVKEENKFLDIEKEGLFPMIKNFGYPEKGKEKKWDWIFSLLQAMIRMNDVDKLSSDTTVVQHLLDSMNDIKKLMVQDTQKNINPIQFVKYVFSFNFFYDDSYFEPVLLLKMILYYLKFGDQARFLITYNEKIVTTEEGKEFETTEEGKEFETTEEGKETFIYQIKIKKEYGGRLFTDILEKKITKASDIMIVQLIQKGDDDIGQPSTVLKISKSIIIDSVKYILKSVVMIDQPEVHSFTYSLINDEWYRFDDNDILLEKSPKKVDIQDIEHEFYMIHLLIYEKDKKTKVNQKVEFVEKKEEIIKIENTEKKKLKVDNLSKQIEGMIDDYDGENKKSSSTASNEKQFQTMADLMNTEIENDTDDDE
jgi:hypothetical protein